MDSFVISDSSRGPNSVCYGEATVSDISDALLPSITDPQFAQLKLPILIECSHMGRWSIRRIEVPAFPWRALFGQGLKLVTSLCRCPHSPHSMPV